MKSDEVSSQIKLSLRILTRYNSCGVCMCVKVVVCVKVVACVRCCSSKVGGVTPVVVLQPEAVVLG